MASSSLDNKENKESALEGSKSTNGLKFRAKHTNPKKAMKKLSTLVFLDWMCLQWQPITSK